MKVSVIIPNFNGADFLGECLESIVSQDLPEKEIIVMDGGSTDLSRRLIREFEKHITHWDSAPDAGPYHAVEKGLCRATGDLLCWINSDDIFLPGALREVAEIFSEDPEIEWLSGMHATFLEMQVLRAKEYPSTDFFFSDDSRYAVQLFRNLDHVDWSLDYILNESPRGGYFLQQESTFWKRELWESVGGFDHRFSLASDYWLWLQFLKRASLTIVDRPFGCFRQSPSQRSERQKEKYLGEARKIAEGHAEQFSEPHDPEGSSSADSKKGESPPETGTSVQTRRIVKDHLCLATSIAPVDVNKQAFCIKTWFEQGCRVLSFNTPDEIAQIQALDSQWSPEYYPILRQVEFVPVRETAREIAGKDLVLLRDIIAHYQQFDDDSVVGLINSDIRIESHIDLYSFAREACAGNACLISSRVDLEDYWSREGQVFIGGLDVFLFRPPHIRDFPMETEFAIGAPWWDYFLAHFFQEAVERVHYPRPVPFYHKRHTTNYPTSLWVHYGEHFLDFFDRELAAKFAEVDGVGYQAEFLATIVRQFAIHFYRTCHERSPIEWASQLAYGSGFHSRMEKLQKNISQWADRAILAEELLQSPHH